MTQCGIKLAEGERLSLGQMDLDLILRLTVAPENRQYHEFCCSQLAFEIACHRLQGDHRHQRGELVGDLLGRGDRRQQIGESVVQL